MTYRYLWQNAYIAHNREAGGYRTPTDTLDAALATIYAMDVRRDDQIDIPDPALNKEEIPVGGTDSRNANGFDADHEFQIGDGSIPLYVQTAIFAYRAMGTCVTTGTDTAISAQTVASVTNATITVTSAGWSVNAYSGMMVVVTAGDNSGSKYHILSNTSEVLTVDKTVPATLATDTIKIQGPPYTHAITENNTSIPSWSVHAEMQNAVDGDSIRTDLLGCLVKQHKIRLESGSGHQDVDYICSKAVAGSEIAKPTELSHPLIELKSISTFTLTYNSATPVLISDVVSIEPVITNDVDIEHVGGDAYALTPKYGLRDYEFNIEYNPTNDTLYGLRNTADASYATTIPLVAKFGSDASHYIQYTYTSMKVADHDKLLPSKDKGYLQSKCTLRNRAGGTLAIEGVDDYGLAYYEGST